MNRSKDLPGLISDPDIVASYSEDALGLRGEFDAVCRPETEEDVAELVRYCAATATPLTVQGLRSSLTGASMAQGGIALSMERMNRLKDLDADDRTAVAEPGMVVAEFRKRVREEGLFYPPDPTSEGECTLGGNVATNAGGLRCAKYGVTGDYVLGLEVVLADGRILRTGSRCMKSVSGYDLTRLFVGSEGTLGVVTEITLSIRPKPLALKTSLAFFSTLIARAAAQE